MKRLCLTVAYSAVILGSIMVPGAYTQSTMADVAQSPIDGNVPPPAVFDKVLKRDLVAYFQKRARPRGGKVTVTYQFLRNGPTQSGVSYPKYYLWVTVHQGAKIAEQGAVRVAAMDRKEFEITHFLSREELRRNPEKANLVFPAPVAEKLQTYIGAVSR